MRKNNGLGWKPLILDTCMINRITTLRNAGIETVACCCGHGHSMPTITTKNENTILNNLNIC